MEDIFLESVSSFLEENHTCPQLAHSLLEALYCEIDEARYPHFTQQHGANEPKFRKLHQLQAFVGWSQLFQGILVLEWSQLQEEFLEENAKELGVDRRHYSGAIWAKKVVILLWSIIRAQWEHRNADRHGRTKHDSESIRRTRIESQITDQYNEANKILAADRPLIDEPLTQKFKKSLRSLELWHKFTRPTIRLSTAEASKAIARTHKRITNFFTRKRPEPDIHKEKDCQDTATA